MKTANFRKLFLVSAVAALLTACGGGADVSVASSAPNMMQQLMSPQSVRMAAQQGANGQAVMLYQALYGKAPSNPMLVSYVSQIGTSDGAAWADAMAANFSTLSNSDFATLVLNNISITPTSLNATAAFGTSKQAYDGLQQAMTDYLNWAGITRRGTVALQISTIIAGMEGETQFGVYGNAAVAFNNQSAVNLSYATDVTHTVAAKPASTCTAPAVLTNGVCVTPAPTVSVQLTKSKTTVGSPVTLSWSSTNATSCVGMDALSGTKAINNSEVITPTAGGQFKYTISCDGAGGTVKQSVPLVVPMPVFKTSYENKNSIDFGNTAIPTIRSLGIPKVYADEMDSPDRSVTFGDFTQEGKYTAFTHVNRATSRFGVPNINDAPGVAYFVQQDATGKWVDVTSKLIPNSTDRLTCISNSFSFTADLNNDGKPDVYLACHGIDYDVSNVTGLGIHAGINIENQIMFLSQPDGTYKRSEIPFQIYGHKAALADLDSDGNIDIVTVSAFNVDNTTPNDGLPFVLWGNGDGTFRRDDTVFTRNLWNYTDHYTSGIWNVELIPDNGKLNLLLIGMQRTFVVKDFGNAIKNGIDYTKAITIPMPVYSTGDMYSLIIDTIFVNNSYYFDATVYSTAASHDMIITIFKYDANGQYQSTLYNFVNSKTNWTTFIAQFKLFDGKFIAYGTGCQPVGRLDQGMCAMSVPIQ